MSEPFKVFGAKGAPSGGGKGGGGMSSSAQANLSDPKKWSGAATEVMSEVNRIVETDRDRLADPCMAGGRWSQLRGMYVMTALSNGKVFLADKVVTRNAIVRRYINRREGLPARLISRMKSGRLFIWGGPLRVKDALPANKGRRKNPPNRKIEPWPWRPNVRKRRRYLKLGSGVYFDRRRSELMGKVVHDTYKDWEKEVTDAALDRHGRLRQDIARTEAKLAALQDRADWFDEQIANAEKRCDEGKGIRTLTTAEQRFREKQGKALVEAAKAGPASQDTNIYNQGQAQQQSQGQAQGQSQGPQPSGPQGTPRPQGAPRPQPTHPRPQGPQPTQPRYDTGTVQQQAQPSQPQGQSQASSTDSPMPWQSSGGGGGWQQQWSQGGSGQGGGELPTLPMFGTDRLEGAAQDQWVHRMVSEAVAGRAEALTDYSEGKISDEDVIAEAINAQNAMVAMGDAVRSLQSANAQLYRTRRGVGEDQRHRHRALVRDVTRLASAYFRDATWPDGAPVDWRVVLPEIPGTYVGPGASFGSVFGARGPAFIEVVAGEAGPMLLTTPSAMIATVVEEAADAIKEAADDVAERTFQFRSLERGEPLFPGQEIMKTLAQASLLPAGPGSGTVWSVGSEDGLGYDAATAFKQPVRWQATRWGGADDEAVNEGKTWPFTAAADRGARNFAEANEGLVPLADYGDDVGEVIYRPTEHPHFVEVPDALDKPMAKLNDPASLIGKRLSYAARKELPDAAFIFPKKRAYPIFTEQEGRLVPSRGHGRAARSRASAAYSEGKMSRTALEKVWRVTSKQFDFPKDTLPERSRR